MYVCVGIDQEGDEEDEEEEEEEDVVMSSEENDKGSEKTDDNAELTKLASEEAKELEEAKKERQELMAHEQQAIRSQYNNDKDPETRLQYLLAQSEVFAHFLAGTYNNRSTTHSILCTLFISPWNANSYLLLLLLLLIYMIYYRIGGCHE